MHPDDTPDYTPILRSLMQQVGLRSFTELCWQTGISRNQVRRLRRGQIHQLPIASVVQLARVLQVSVQALWTQFTPAAAAETVWGEGVEASQPSPGLAQEISPLRTEYDRLQRQLAQQRQALLQEFQQATLLALESLLLQWPTAAYAAQQNPQAPAVKLLPLLRPLEQLLRDWQVDAIGTVGTEVPYDPQWHQLMRTGSGPGTSERVTAGDPVRVRYVGYRQGDCLLHRAKVSIP